MHQAAVAPLLPGVGQEDHQPLGDGEQAGRVLAAAEHLLEVAQHPRDHLARPRRLEEATERRVAQAAPRAAAAIRHKQRIERVA